MDKKVPTDGVVNGLLKYLKRQMINHYFAEWGIMRYHEVLYIQQLEESASVMVRR